MVGKRVGMTVEWTVKRTYGSEVKKTYGRVVKLVVFYVTISMTYSCGKFFIKQIKL